MNEDDKRRIEEEEAYRAKVRQSEERKAKSAKGRRQAMGCLGLVGVVFIIAIIAALSGPSPEEQAEAERQAAAEEAQRRAVEGPYTATDVRLNCEDLIKKQLLSPSSAKFPGVFSDIRTEPRRFSDHPDGKFWAWTTYLDADNAFGATLRSRWNCRVYDDGHMTVEQWE